MVSAFYIGNYTYEIFNLGYEEVQKHMLSILQDFEKIKSKDLLNEQNSL